MHRMRRSCNARAQVGDSHVPHEEREEVGSAEARPASFAHPPRGGLRGRVAGGDGSEALVCPAVRDRLEARARWLHAHPRHRRSRHSQEGPQRNVVLGRVG
eukprot:15031545-Alexandrium_andersonii.AAC.1